VRGADLDPRRGRRRRDRELAERPRVADRRDVGGRGRGRVAGHLQAQAVVAPAHDRDRVGDLGDALVGHHLAGSRRPLHLDAAGAEVALGRVGEALLPGERGEDEPRGRVGRQVVLELDRAQHHPCP
jgi:hypothetical protein